VQGIQRVDFDEIATLSASISTAAETMQATLDRMNGNLETLRTAFTGEAADAYQVAKEKWTLQMTEMTLFLSTISNAAASAGKALAATEAGIIKSL
jgi:early secretory antigenic target protein ESAT-6